MCNNLPEKKFCKCIVKRTDKWIKLNLPLKNGYLINLLIGKCKKCGKWVVSSELDFRIAVLKGTEEARILLLEYGLIDEEQR